MSRYTGPKDRLSRREGRELFGRKVPKRINQPPGQHGKTKTKALSYYARQLREKQALKRMYGMKERQFKRFYQMAHKEASKYTDVTTGETFLQLLEMRLDNVVYRLGLAKTRPQARQFVHYGYISVNGKVIDIPPFIVAPGQYIELKSSLFEKPFYQEILKETHELPSWLEVREGKGYVVRKPERKEITVDIDESLVIAFYSK